MFKATLQIPSLLSLRGEHIRPLTREETEQFVAATLGERSGANGLKGDFTETEAGSFGPIGWILFKRLALCEGLRVTTALAAWVAMRSEGNPGNLVMWAWTLREMWIRKPNKEVPVDMQEWAFGFPDGVPTAEGLSKTWDRQKNLVGGGNLLDIVQIWAMPVKEKEGA